MRVSFFFVIVALVATTSAKPVSYRTVVQRMYQMGPSNQAGSFPYDISAWEDANTRSVQDKANLATFFAKCDANKNVASNGKKAVVVGGGPNGLTAAIALRAKGFDVVVLEKTDGHDQRYNKVTISDALNNGFFHSLVGVHVDGGGPNGGNDNIGKIPESEYLLGAAAVLSGIEVIYSKQYVGHCPAAKTLFYRDTPANVGQARTKPAKTVVCAAGYTAANTVKVDNVRLVVGAGGTGSFVRKNMGWTFDHRRTFTAPVVIGGQPVQKTFRMIDDSVTNPGHYGRAFAMVLDFHLANPGDIHAVTNMFDAMHIGTTPQPHLNMWFGNDFGKDTAVEVAKHGQQLVTLQYGMTPYTVQPQGNPTARPYVDVMLRHNAGKALKDVYDEFLNVEALAEVVRLARGQALQLGWDNKKKTRANRFIKVVHQLVMSKDIKKKTATALTNEQTFRAAIRKMKIYPQRMRTANHIVDTTTECWTVLVGDATRDSYFVGGKSYNSAALAFLAFVDGDGLHNDAAKRDAAANAYYARAVEEFAQETAAELYFSAYCGIEVSHRRADGAIDGLKARGFEGAGLTINAPPAVAKKTKKKKKKKKGEMDDMPVVFLNDPGIAFQKWQDDPRANTPELKSFYGFFKIVLEDGKKCDTRD